MWGSYYPEANVLLPMWHYAEGSKTPAAKSIPVTAHKESDSVVVPAMAAEQAAGARGILVRNRGWPGGHGGAAGCHCCAARHIVPVNGPR
jgi:hypothetical protein